MIYICSSSDIFQAYLACVIQAVERDRQSFDRDYVSNVSNRPQGNNNTVSPSTRLFTIKYYKQSVERGHTKF